ncbi:MAG: CotH kinase family protein [Phycisphaerae bacterium]|nr:CotH kinase family protein [Phycisphaerae bacterium]
MGVCCFLEQQPLNQSLKRYLRYPDLNTGMLSRGVLGRQLKEQGLVYAVPNEGDRFGSLPIHEDEDGLTLFQKKRQSGSYVFRANPGGMATFPSSQVLDVSSFVTGWPVVSIVVNEDDLYSPERGIVTNFNGRGRQWERFAYISYYDESGHLQFATGAGLRLHGGRSRRPPTPEELNAGKMLEENARQKKNSFRLYFRDDYGIDRISPGVIFASDTAPIKTLVVRYEKQKSWPFRCCMAMDIVRQIGGVVSEAKPALFFLNGRLMGAYFICEHVSKRQWQQRLGNDTFAFYRYKGQSDPESSRAYQMMASRVMNMKQKLTMEEVARNVDIENLTGYLFSSVFSGTSDALQGAVVYDYDSPGSRWFWINWDLDGSSYHSSPTERQTWETALYRKYNGRIPALLFTRLLNESTEYRKYLIQFVMGRLNHRVNSSFLRERGQYYDGLAKAYGLNESQFFCNQAFADLRADYVCAEMRRNLPFDPGPTFTCCVKGPEGTRYVIDGYQELAGYTGKYFVNWPVTICPIDQDDRAISGWRVNGKPYYQETLSLSVHEDLLIEPIFAE